MKLPFKMLKKRPKIIIFCKCPDQTMDLINMLLPVTDRRSTMCRFYILNTNTSLSLCLLLWHQCWSEDLTVNNCLIEGKQHKRRIWDKNKSRCFCMRLVAGYCTIRFSFFFFCVHGDHTLWFLLFFVLPLCCCKFLHAHCGLRLCEKGFHVIQWLKVEAAMLCIHAFSGTWNLLIVIILCYKSKVIGAYFEVVGL